jgi:hypothetical protein
LCITSFFGSVYLAFSWVFGANSGFVTTAGASLLDAEAVSDFKGVAAVEFTFYAFLSLFLDAAGASTYLVSVFFGSSYFGASVFTAVTVSLAATVVFAAVVWLA